MTFQTEQPAQAENSLLSMRRHGRILTLPLVLLIAVVGAGGYFVGNLPEPWMNWAAGLGAAAIVLLCCIGPLLSWLSNRTTITNRRVIVRSGFFVHRRVEVPLSRVREVRSKRNPIQRMFGSGNVELIVGSETTVLRDLPASGALVDALQELIERNYLTTQAEQQAFNATAQSTYQ